MSRHPVRYYEGFPEFIIPNPVSGWDDRARKPSRYHPVVFTIWGEAINMVVYLHQRSPKEGLKRDDRDDDRAQYEMPYEMLPAKR